MQIKTNTFKLTLLALLAVLQISSPAWAMGPGCFELFGTTSVLTVDASVRSENQKLGGMSFTHLLTNPRHALNQFLLLKLEEMPAEKFVSIFYPVYGKKNIETFATGLSQINPTWVRLLAFPGIVQRAQRFMDFVQKNNYENLSVEQVYQKFSDHLGHKKVYRAISLPSNTDVAKLKTQPLLSKYLQDTVDGKHDGTTPLEKQIVTFGTDEDHHLQVTSLPKALSARFNQAPDFFTLSVTERPSIGINVTKMVQERHDIKGHSVFLFTFEIPAIEIITPGQDFDYNYRTDGFYPTVKGIGPEIESFIYGGLSASEIKNVELIDDKLDLYYYTLRR